MIEVALADPRWAVVAVETAAARRSGRVLAEVLGRAPLDHDAQAMVAFAVARVPDDQLAHLVTQLEASPRAGVRRAAVTALGHDARPGRGWSAPRLAALARLRADPDPEVAGAAARLWPPREVDPGW